MVLQILSDTGQVVNHWDTFATQQLARTDS